MRWASQRTPPALLSIRATVGGGAGCHGFRIPAALTTTEASALAEGPALTGTGRGQCLVAGDQDGSFLYLAALGGARA